MRKNAASTASEPAVNSLTSLGMLRAATSFKVEIVLQEFRIGVAKYVNVARSGD